MSAKHSKGRLVFERNSFQSDEKTGLRCITGHYFNSAVDILLPGRDSHVAGVDDIIQTDMAFLVRNVHLQSLLNCELIEGFVKKGSLYMLSHGTCIDSDDCVCILPTGVLLLNLCKDTFQELGLPGTPSKAAKHSGKYVVQIDLTKKFWPGNKFYERVKECLTGKPNLQFDFLITWTPQDPQVCPSSIQNFFTSNNFTCNRIKLTHTSSKFINFAVPVISPDVYSTDEESNSKSCDYTEVFDWLGACSVGIELTEKSPDDFVSTCSSPCPNHTLANGHLIQYRGMISPACVQQIVNCLRHTLQTENLPWCSVTVHGFMDSPVSWFDRDHGFYDNGDNLYTIVIFPDSQYWLYMAVGGQDIVP